MQARKSAKTAVDYEYEDLPPVIKHAVDQAAYRWMGQANRERLLQECTEPDPEPDEEC